MYNIDVYLSFRVMVKDPFHANCLPVHIGTLVELGKANGKVHLSAFLPFIKGQFYVFLRRIRSSVFIPKYSNYVTSSYVNAFYMFK